MAAKTMTKDRDLSHETLMVSDGLYVMAAGYGGGSGNSGIGGGGGSPGGGTPGGGGGGGNGGGGGKPGGESFGNNLSFPAVFFDEAPMLRSPEGGFTFTTPTYLTAPPPPDFPADYADYVYFAQGVEGNTWRADYLVAPEGQRIAVDFVDLGDALESAPIKAGTNVRLELTLYQDVANPDAGEPRSGDDTTLTGFDMTLLGGAKGSGKPDKVGPTESQGARLDVDSWEGSPVTGATADDSPSGTTYESPLASIYAAETPTVGEGETAESYMSMTVQRVTGLAEGQTTEDAIAALEWIGSQWVDADGGDGITVGGNLANTAFGPELNIGGKYIMGASGKPFKFTSDGDYLVTFAIDDGAPLYFDSGEPGQGFTEMTNVAGARQTLIVEDDGVNGEHNGLLVMLVGVPSSADTGGEGE
jgi:hypothetical protein